MAKIIQNHNGYRKLRSFQSSTIVYDCTEVFCTRFISKDFRMKDQMIQAARSGRQNIAEGSAAAATSTRTEIHLTNVAKASLEELLLDYEDFLRQRNLELWDKNHPYALYVRKLSQQDQQAEKYLWIAQGKTAEQIANSMICLINQTTYLLRRQINHLEEQFLKHGGFKERMYQERKKRK